MSRFPDKKDKTDDPGKLFPSSCNSHRSKSCAYIVDFMGYESERRMLCPPLQLSLSVTSRIGTSRVSVAPKGCGKNRGKPSVVCVQQRFFSRRSWPSQCVSSTNDSVCVQYKRLSVGSIRTFQCVSSTNVPVCVQYKCLTVCSVWTSQCMLSTQYERVC